jgi:hypothetical protein
MGPENFFSSGMFLVPLVMMLLFFLIMRFGFGKGPFFGNTKIPMVPLLRNRQ